ncbi:hypothetical protein DFH94DRAFT_227108 [Russula ochroleuca]|uniref:Uncharacterized protein n=1 Tax=Russula ochroleuca TaxID=152965 RepID=A0A9P5JXK6_9AGAM|nr:hypothetical protein DFH94DRAFT_227108 [Russula ochroleuca]
MSATRYSTCVDFVLIRARISHARRYPTAVTFFIMQNSIQSQRLNSILVGISASFHFQNLFSHFNTLAVAVFPSIQESKIHPRHPNFCYGSLQWVINGAARDQEKSCAEKPVKNKGHPLGNGWSIRVCTVSNVSGLAQLFLSCQTVGGVDSSTVDGEPVNTWNVHIASRTRRLTSCTNGGRARSANIRVLLHARKHAWEREIRGRLNLCPL